MKGIIEECRFIVDFIGFVIFLKECIFFRFCFWFFEKLKKIKIYVIVYGNYMYVIYGFMYVLVEVNGYWKILDLFGRYFGVNL